MVIKLPLFFLKVEKSIFRFFGLLVLKPTKYTLDMSQTHFKPSRLLLTDTRRNVMTGRGSIIFHGLKSVALKFEFYWSHEPSFDLQGWMLPRNMSLEWPNCARLLEKYVLYSNHRYPQAESYSSEIWNLP